MAPSGEFVTQRQGTAALLYNTRSASGTTRFLYDCDELIGEYASSGAQLRRYVHGVAIDDPVIWYEGSGTGASALRHLLADRQGGATQGSGDAHHRWKGRGG